MYPATLMNPLPMLSRMGALGSAVKDAMMYGAYFRTSTVLTAPYQLRDPLSIVFISANLGFSHFLSTSQYVRPCHARNRPGGWVR